MNRTLIAPRPSIVTEMPASAATSARERAMTRSPSRTAPPMPIAFALAAAAALGRPASRATPRMSTTEMRNVDASTTRTGQTWPATAATTPVMPPPMTLATIRVAWLRELAASRPSAGTTRGSMAMRAGAKNVPTTAWRAGEGEQRRDRLLAGDEEHGEDDDGPQRVRHEHDPAPVVAVGVGAREQADRHRRQRDEDRHQGDGGRRPGEVEDEQEQGEVRHPVADVGDRLGEVQPAEVGDAEQPADAHVGGGGGRVSHRSAPRCRCRC